MCLHNISRNFTLICLAEKCLIYSFSIYLGNNQNTGKSNFEDVLRGKLMQQPCSSHTFPEETLTSFRIPKTIEFGNISFHLDQSSPKYSRLNYRSFNEDLLKSKSHWHLVVVISSAIK